MTTTPTRWKAQSQVNITDGGFNQDQGRVAGSPAGHYFVVWRSASSGDLNVLGRHYDAFGNPASGEIGLTAFVDGFQFSPDIAAMTGGGLAVAYVDQFSGDNDINVRITTPTLGFGRNDFVDIDDMKQTFGPAITVFADNSYAVAYTVQVSGTESDVVGRIVSNVGIVGAQFDILNETDVTTAVDLATLTNGNFVAVYESQSGGIARDVFYRIFNSAGTALIGSTVIPSAGSSADEYEPSVAALKGGGFVATWTDSLGDASEEGIRAAVINSNGVVIRDNILVNVVSQSGEQDESSVTALADGGFFVTWEDEEAGLVRGQRFDPSGNIVGSEVVIGIADSPEVASLSDGRLAFAVGVFNAGEEDVATTIFDARTTLIDNVSVASIVGDGTADYLLHRDAAGVRNLLAFQINDHTVVSTTSLGAIGADFKIDGANDFDGDGDSDILMHRDVGATRTYTIEQMGPGGVQAAVNIGSVGTEWFVVGTGDFNNDNDGDVLLHKDVGGTRNYLILDMQSNVVQAGIAAGAVGTDWQVDGLGDFDNDGDSDSVMHRDVGGVRNLTIFQMQNSGVVTTSSLGALGADWQIDGVGDFDRDGDADILMRRDALDVRNLTVLEIANNTVVTAHSLGNIGNNLSIGGVGDFDLDGDADVSLHFDTGSVRNYLTLETENHVVVASHTLGAIGGDFVVA